MRERLNYMKIICLGIGSEFDEHLDAHKGNYKISTDGYYNPETRKMVEFEGGVPWK